MQTLNKEIPIFGGRLRFIICEKLDEIELRYRLGDTSDCDAISFKTKDKFSERVYVMAFNRNAVKNHIIAHEALHITNFILYDINHVSSYTNDEVQAYLLTWIVKQFDKAFKNI